MLEQKFNARRAVTAGLVAMMGISSLPVSAFAASGETGTIKINATDANIGAKYSAYRIFKADVKTIASDDASMPHRHKDIDGNDVEIAFTHDDGQEFDWDSAEDRRIVLEFLNQGIDETGAPKTYTKWLQDNGHTEDVNGVPARQLAQNACEYITQMISYSEEDTDAATSKSATDPTGKTVMGNSFATRLAQWLNVNGAVVDVNAKDAGTAINDQQGYYLFFTDPSSLGIGDPYDQGEPDPAAGDAGQAPMWVAISDTAKTVTEKAAFPTLIKQVKEDASGEFGDLADANRNQEVSFRIIGTLPANYKAFSDYFYSFEDQLPAGMSLVGEDLPTQRSGVKVTHFPTGNYETDGTGVDVTNKFQITYENDKLVVTCEDLVASGIQNISKNSVFVVTYNAVLDNDGVIGGSGNTNTAKLIYSNNPIVMSDGHTDRGETTTDDTTVYTYKLRLMKVDKATREVLDHAKFTVKVKTTDGTADTDSKDKYVQMDGSLGVAPFVFETGVTQYYDDNGELKTPEKGEIVLPRIDKGTYLIEETEAPADYDKMDAPIEAVVGATLPATTKTALSGMTLSVSGGENGVLGTPDPVTHVVADHDDGVIEVNAGTGTVATRVSDPKIIYLPGTGLTASQAGTIAGAALLACGIVLVARRRAVEEL